MVERSEDPPKHGGKWWVFAALDHTLHRASANHAKLSSVGPPSSLLPCQPGSPKVRGVIQELSTAEYRCPGENLRDFPRRSFGAIWPASTQPAVTARSATIPPVSPRGRFANWRKSVRGPSGRRCFTRKGSATWRSTICGPNWHGGSRSSLPDDFRRAGRQPARAGRRQPTDGGRRQRWPPGNGGDHRGDRRRSPLDAVAKPSTSDRQARRARPGPSNIWLPTEAFSWAMPAAPRTPSG